MNRHIKRFNEGVYMIYQTLLDRCPHIPTIDMEGNAAWLDKRREGIGGSDAGAIMGMSAYSSPLTVYLQKKKLVPNGETSKAARRGIILEPMIRVETTRDFPELEIEPLPFMLADPEYPFMLANIDSVIFAKTPVEIRGEVVEGLGGHEIKSAKTAFGWGDDEIRDTYYCQVQPLHEGNGPHVVCDVGLCSGRRKPLPLCNPSQRGIYRPSGHGGNGLLGKLYPEGCHACSNRSRKRG
jgi:putative phage-type endonuclease